MQLGSEPWIPDKQILEICHCRSETILLTPNSSCEACSAFTRVAACTLARSPYFVTRYPKASDISSPPCLLRLLPAGAVAGSDLHPLENADFSRRTPKADRSSHPTFIYVVICSEPTHLLWFDTTTASSFSLVPAALHRSAASSMNALTRGERCRLLGYTTYRPPTGVV